jgi:hypothetical protein
MTQNGKGSKPRPVNRKRFEAGWDGIEWKSKANQAVGSSAASPAAPPRHPTPNARRSA